jgi:multidrug resistance efflux pump
MNSLAPQFSDPFVGVTVMDGTDYEFRCDRYKKLLEAAKNMIRKLEGELAERDERIDDLEQQAAYHRANGYRHAPCTVDGAVVAYGVKEALGRMNVCARGEAEIRDDWNPAKA